MLHDILRIALVGMGALSMYARVMARSTELRRPRAPRAVPQPEPQQ